MAGGGEGGAQKYGSVLALMWSASLVMLLAAATSLKANVECT